MCACVGWLCGLATQRVSHHTHTRLKLNSGTVPGASARSPARPLRLLFGTMADATSTNRDNEIADLTKERDEAEEQRAEMANAYFGSEKILKRVLDIAHRSENIGSEIADIVQAHRYGLPQAHRVDRGTQTPAHGDGDAHDYSPWFDFDLRRRALEPRERVPRSGGAPRECVPDQPPLPPVRHIQGGRRGPARGRTREGSYNF